MGVIINAFAIFSFALAVVIGAFGLLCTTWDPDRLAHDSSEQVGEYESHAA